MERVNSKHSPRLDEQMSREVAGTVQGTTGSRAEEWRQPEPAGEDQPEPTTVPSGETGGFRTGTPMGMSAGDIEQRSRIGRYLNRSALPGDREALLRSARDNEAPAGVIAELDRLPRNAEFRTVAEVWAALGHTNETHRA